MLMVISQPLPIHPTSFEEANPSLPSPSVSKEIDLPRSPTKSRTSVPSRPEDLEFDVAATHIISSPYSHPANHLHLTPLAPPIRLLAFALTLLRATRPDYATAPYLCSFTWPAVCQLLRTACAQAGTHWQRTELHVVIFRSRLREGCDRARLAELDRKSHEEACASGGLLRYWFGEPDGEGRNLATCIWRNREDAAAGGRGPWHRKARGAAREMYEDISFYTHVLVIEDGAAAWHLADYEQ